METAAKPNPSFGYLLATWFRQAYDEMGTLLLGNVLLFLVVAIALGPVLLFIQFAPTGDSFTFVPHGLAMILLLVLGGWLTTCAWMTMNEFVIRLLTFKYPSWRYYFGMFSRSLLQSFGVFVLLAGTFGVFAFNLAVYPAMLAERPWLLNGAVVLTLWMALFVGLIQVHLIPFLARGECGIWTGLRRSALVVLWKPFRSLFVLMAQIFLFMFAIVPPFCLVFPALVAVLLNLNLLILLEEWRDPFEKTPEAVRAGA